MHLPSPGKIRLSAKIAAMLGDQVDESFKRRFPWSIERARIGSGKEVPVEVIVNGYPVARQTVVADGAARDLKFDVPDRAEQLGLLSNLSIAPHESIFVDGGRQADQNKQAEREWCLKA